MERYSKELVAVEPFVLNSVEHYPRALETTVKSQQSELEKLRREVERERGCRVEAERCAEETKTELINAQSTYALRLAEQRASHAEELEKRVEERFSRSKEESRQHSRMADARASQLAEDLASNRALLESQQTRHDEELRKEREKHGTTTEESARELQALRRNFARNESERNNELRNLLTQRAHLHHRISLLACVRSSPFPCSSNFTRRSSLLLSSTSSTISPSRQKLKTVQLSFKIFAKASQRFSIHTTFRFPFHTLPNCTKKSPTP